MPRLPELPGGLTVTRPEKVLFPGNGFTKGDMLRYYAAVAPALLPHLRGRPITMVRWPDGVRGGHFYEKNAPAFAPSWIRIARVARSGGEPRPIRYLRIEDARSLLWVANLASIEIHPFLHRFPKVDAPTCLAFDLDPGEGAGLIECIEVAGLLKDALERLGLKGWPKVTGSKGLQVYVPLNTRVTYAQTKPFAHALARLLAHNHPDLVVSDMAKGIRRRKVLVDWSQNDGKKTTVAVYSLRGKRDEPFVSAPVSWEELSRARSQKSERSLFFTPDQVLRRVERMGDLFAPVLTVRQRLPKTD